MYTCLVAGLVGGFLKSLFEHNGSIVLPKVESCKGGSKIIVLGTLTDLFGGVVFGWLSYYDAFYAMFGAASPNVWLSFLSGFCWIVIIQSVMNKIGLGDKGYDLQSKGKKLLNVLGTNGCCTPILPLIVPLRKKRLNF